MWSTRTEQVARGSVIRLELEGNLVRFSHVLHGWRDDPNFRTLFNDLLARAPYEAFRQETPPITADFADRPFEFALLDMRLDQRPKYYCHAPYRQHTRHP